MLEVYSDSNQDINIMYSGRDKKNKKGRFSSEFTMLSILEYLYVNSRKTPVSKYNIVTNTPGIRQQRADRVNHMMDSLENNGYIISEHTSSNITFYKVTQKGVDEYERWIKNFLDFARSTNITGSIDKEIKGYYSGSIAL